MTVAEMIEALKAFPPDMKVAMWAEHDEGFVLARSVHFAPAIEVSSGWRDFAEQTVGEKPTETLVLISYQSP